MTDESATSPVQPIQDPAIHQILLLKSIEHHLAENTRNQQLILEKLASLIELQEDTAEFGADVNLKKLEMGIGEMVEFIFKWTIASIPVAIVIGGIYAIIFAIYLAIAF